MSISGTATLLTILFSLAASCWLIFFTRPAESLIEEVRSLIELLIRGLLSFLAICFFALIAYTVISVIATSAVDFRIFVKLWQYCQYVFPGILLIFSIIILSRLISSEIRRRAKQR